jgi:hypothetical protein
LAVHFVQLVGDMFMHVAIFEKNRQPLYETC